MERSVPLLHILKEGGKMSRFRRSMLFSCADNIGKLSRSSVAITLSLSGKRASPEVELRNLVSHIQARSSLSGDISTSNLPPIEDILPVIEDYFVNLNGMIPLFDRSMFMPMLIRNVTRQTPGIIAAVNVILALAFQYRATTHSPISDFDLLRCTSNAQHIMTSQESGYDNLLTLQNLLGLIILHLGTPHPGLARASFLLGGAIKLVHRLRLHRSKANDLFDPQTKLQRVRIFWIAFILDKDISLRTHEPPLIQEHDHDVSAPFAANDSGLTRFAFDDEEESYIDLFQAWINLSRIQGKIYDELYSVHAESLSLDTQQHTTREIHARLTEWLERMPNQLRSSRLRSVYPKTVTGHLVFLYFTRMSCFLHTHKVGTNDAEWITRLVNYSQRIVRSTEPEAVLDTALSPFLEPTSAWPDIVKAARECATLFRLVEWEDSRLTW